VTGGYIYVLVLVDEAGKVITESRISASTCRSEAGARLVPAPWEGPNLGLCGFRGRAARGRAVPYRVAAVRDAWPSASDRALYVLIKERKSSRAGCVDAWQRDQERLIVKASAFSRQPSGPWRRASCSSGPRRTLADAALYGLCKMLEEADRAPSPFASPSH